MARLLGHRNCPVCGWESARAIETQKAGRPMLYCDRCESQIFARGERAAGILTKGIRPLDDAPAPVPEPSPAPTRPEKPRRAAGFLDEL